MGLRAILCLTLLVVAWPPPAAAQAFLDDYDAGVEAAEAGDWAEAERLMRRAIDSRPEESRRLLRFFRLRPYLPHLYLGLALAEQDRCTAALESLAESERQGVAPELEEEHRLLRDARERCREHLADEAEAERRREEIATVLERARDLHAAIRALGPEREPARMHDLATAWREGDPSLAERLGEVEGDLERAAAALGNRPGRSDVLDAIADLTRSVVSRLEGIRKEAELRRDAVRSQRDAARERVALARRQARELLAATGSLAEGVDVVARRRSALEEVVERAAAAETGTELRLDELDELERTLRRGIAAVGAVAEPPPDLLVEAADTWLAGRPRDVLQLLAERGQPEGETEAGVEGEAGAERDSPMAELDDRARAHALLLRAAAAFDLFHAGGAREPELLERARRDARECHRLAPSLAPVARIFSPRFRRFFETAEPAPETEPAPEPGEAPATDDPEAPRPAGNGP